MKKSMVALLTGVSMAALLAGGCANKDVVKKEEAIVPTVAAEKVEPAKPVDTAEQARLAEQAALAEKARLAAEQAEQARLAAAKSKPAQNEVMGTNAPQGGNSAVAENKFETIYFDFDKSDLRQDARDVLSKNAEAILKSSAGAKVQIEGHCDERGSAEYNLALGERRAMSVQKYLTTLSVKAENLSVISYGKEKPAVVGSDEAAWAKNRRAEFVITK
ncbi:MAG: peptidoglycan-associated lipoprotein Pal [Desulfuromonadales bacterium]